MQACQYWRSIVHFHLRRIFLKDKLCIHFFHVYYMWKKVNAKKESLYSSAARKSRWNDVGVNKRRFFSFSSQLVIMIKYIKVYLIRPKKKAMTLRYATSAVRFITGGIYFLYIYIVSHYTSVYPKTCTKG